MPKYGVMPGESTRVGGAGKPVGPSEAQIEVFLVGTIENIVDAGDQFQIFGAVVIAAQIGRGEPAGAFFDDGWRAQN